jgi:cytochrome c
MRKESTDRGTNTPHPLERLRRQTLRDPRRLAGASAAVFLAMAFFAFPRISRASSERTGDAERGKTLFEKRCTGCHSLDQDKEGPRLRSVYGRKAGTIDSFEYSDALKKAHIVWDETTLDKWLIDTDTLVPGNDMSFHVPKAEERTDIIAFLRSMSQTPHNQ